MSPTLPQISPRRFLALSLSSVLLLVGISILIGVRNELTYRDTLRHQVESQTEVLASSVSAALSFGDVATLRQYADALMLDPRIASIAVYGPDEAPLVKIAAPGQGAPPDRLADYGERSSRGSNIVIRPVVEKGQRLGAVFLRTRGEPMSAVVTRHGSLALLTLVAFVLLAVVNWVASRYAFTNNRLRDEMAAREAAEAQLVQAQKMEAMGQMTGGVAHDFNNLLMVASSGLELLDRTEDPARRERIKQSVRQAIDRGANLTQQLLAFSRRAPIKAEVVDLCARMRGMATLLERSVSPGVELAVTCATNLWRVEIDASQFEVAILNMALNARDAMGGAGRLSITLDNHADAAGERVRIRVADNGAGMSPEVAERIFEPFFTTKGVGKGTGLGLSQVYGFVRSSGGDIEVRSVVGQGTTFALYLPRTHKRLEGEADVEPVARPTGASKRSVLLVEDNDDVAVAVAEMLEALGYDARRAADGRSALAALEERCPDLVLTDMVMPGEIDGLALAREIERRGLAIPIILSTGYSDAASEVNAEGRRLLMKPYRMEALALELSEALDG